MRSQSPVGRALQFGLRWVLALVLLVRAALTVADYRVFRDAVALPGPTLRVPASLCNR